MSDGRRPENPSLPSNHTGVPGPAATGTVPSSLGMPISSQQQPDASFNFMIPGRMGTFPPPLNMAPIFPPAPPTAPGMKAPSGKPGDLGPPMFQIPLNLGHPVMSMGPRASSTGGPPSLANPSGMFIASGANPAALYNSMQTPMSHAPFLMFQHGSAAAAPGLPTVSALPSVMSDRPQVTPSTSSPPIPAKTSAKTMNRAVSVSSSSPSSSPASPSQPRKKHSPMGANVPSSGALPAMSGSNSLNSPNQEDDVSIDTGGNGPYNSYHDMKQGKMTAKQAADLARLSQVLPGFHSPPVMVLPPFAPTGAPLFQMQQQSKAPVNAAIPGSNMVRSLADAVQDVVSDGQSMFGSNMQSAPSFDPDQLLTHYNTNAPYTVVGSNRGESVPGRRGGDTHPHGERKTVGLPSDGSGATVHNRDSNEVVTSMADGITEPSGGSQHGAPSDHKITSLVQAASKALSATSGQQQSPSGPAVKTEKTHSHFPNDDLGSEAGVVSVKEELPPVNSVTHAVAGRGSYRQGGAGLSPTLPSTPGQGTLKSASLPSSTAGKTQAASVPPTGLTPGSISHAAPVPSAAPPGAPFSLTNSPRASSGMPSSPVSTPPRPSILFRKRSHDNLRKGDPLSPDASRTGSLGMSGNQSDSNHHSSDNSTDMLSPRKKPRKQNMLLTDDIFASNVPEGPMDGAHALACRNEDLPPSPERGGSPSMGRGASKQQSEGVGPAVKRLFMDDTDFETRLRCLAELKRPSVLNGCKVNTKAAHCHFWRYSDLRTKEQSKPTVFSIAQKRNSRLRVKGWRVGRINDQLESMVEIENAVLSTMSRVKQCTDELVASQQNPLEGKARESLLQIVQGNFDRSNNLLVSFQRAQAVLRKIITHKSNAVDLVQKCAPDVFSLSTVKDRLLSPSQKP